MKKEEGKKWCIPFRPFHPLFSPQPNLFLFLSLLLLIVSTWLTHRWQMFAFLSPDISFYPNYGELKEKSWEEERKKKKEKSEVNLEPTSLSLSLFRLRQETELERWIEFTWRKRWRFLPEHVKILLSPSSYISYNFLTFFLPFLLSATQFLSLTTLSSLVQRSSNPIVAFEQKRMRGDKIEEERERKRGRKMAKVANKGRDQLSVSVLPDYLFFILFSLFLYSLLLSLPFFSSSLIFL